MSFESWPCRKRAASAPRTRTTPKSSSEKVSMCGVAGFSIVFARVSGGSSGRILADFAPMQNAPGDLERAADAEAVQAPEAPVPYVKPRETGGPPGPEPTRFGDWERKGRCIDF